MTASRGADRIWSGAALTATTSSTKPSSGGSAQIRKPRQPEHFFLKDIDATVISWSYLRQMTRSTVN